MCTVWEQTYQMSGSAQEYSFLLHIIVFWRYVWRVDWFFLVFQHVLPPWPSFLTFTSSSKGHFCSAMLVFNAIQAIATLDMSLGVWQWTHRALLLKRDNKGAVMGGTRRVGVQCRERERVRKAAWRTRDSEPEHLLDYLCFKTFNHCLWLRVHTCHGMHAHISP